MNSTQEKLWTINDIKDAARASGSHWFDPQTMRFFGTRVLPTVYQGPGGIYFVTSDHDYARKRKYSVRQFTPPGDINTVGDVASMTQAVAVRRAKTEAVKAPGLARLVAPEEGGVPYEALGLKTTEEAFRPVSVLAHFAHDLQKHTRPDRGTETETVDAARLLIVLAGKHHRLMERLCSDEGFCRATKPDGSHPAVDRCRSRIVSAARKAGVKEVRFSGDPRGCTVRLIFADGFQADSANDGYCVPTEFDADVDE